MRELLTVKSNVEQMLKMDDELKCEKEKDLGQR